jgi:EAL domain-containing protein (putative c-di-GMP-specific phosphodiesterase class I)/GGDEF domain-containing protein
MTVSHYASLLDHLRTWPMNTLAALYYVDIRQLSTINRIADATEGDAVIASVEESLRDWVGPRGVSGRLWSNEFVAIRLIDHPQAVVDGAASLRDVLAALTYQCSIGETQIATSIGASLVSPGADWATTIAEAGDACETAKRRGVNQFCSTHPGRRRSQPPAVNIDRVAAFRQLMQDGSLTLHPQPIMDIRKTRPQLRKAEFLMRVEHKGVFMPLSAGTIETLEHFGLSTDLDRFSARFILDWLSDNRQVLEKLDEVSINLSGRSIVDGAFMDSLLRDVRAAALPPGKLIFEITETAAIDNLDVAAEVIADFRGIGCGFSLDDFGSGLCSFGYLQSLPVDEVKIDGRFIGAVDQEGASQEIVRAIHHVARATGKRTVAEFVDNVSKLQALRRIGVDYAQGWLFYPTLPPEKLVELLYEEPSAAVASSAELEAETAVSK